MAHAAVIALLLVVPLFVVYRRFVRRAHVRPPGPPGLPLLGNVRDIPAPHQFPWLKYHAWCREYNTEILCLNALGMNIIVLDTIDAARELLDKRSSIYSDRPRMIMLNELAGFGWNFGSMDYGEDWRVCRKMTHQEFHATPFKKYRPVLAKHAYDLVRRLASDCGARVPAHLKHMVGANIMEVTYGINVLPEHDPFIELAEAGQECVGRCATAGVYLVELLPILRHLPVWFPGAKFQREAKAWHEKATRQLQVPYEDFLQRLKTGQVDDCMAKALLDTFGDDKETERLARMTTATMYMGGSETIAASMHSFILAMLLYPAVQERARSEVEKVLGTHRLPTFDDFGSIPYVDALIRETLRWHPIVPLDLPHKLREDDVYNGYHLEKGSLVMVNHWAILHYEKHYPDPHTFNPARFLKDGVLDPDVLDPAEAAFGFGRRVCPGRHMAYDTMWIAIVCVLVCLELGQAEEGRVGEDFVSSFVSEPKPFLCEIRYRSEAYGALLRGL
ncbi:cytochrome P450 [Lentinus tigrinus ALCF2SS1-7]|uniref:cytochrome P450 n=1 Tax=Lentinus tigrinus ALCF2SS1-7 TaxID=1328758 RepID=UPI001165D7DC|nr:cytochrome P450 [Lentinus tigrinus ALCF2SS1-7]